MSKKYTFIAVGLDVDDDDIDEKINLAVERYAAKKGIESPLITDFFNAVNGKGVQVNIEDVSE